MLCPRDKTFTTDNNNNISWGLLARGTHEAEQGH